MAKRKLQLQYVPKFNLRLQPDLKMALERQAKASARSLNAEITEILERSQTANGGLQDYSDGELIDELIRRWGRDNVRITLGKEEST